MLVVPNVHANFLVSGRLGRLLKVPGSEVELNGHTVCDIVKGLLLEMVVVLAKCCTATIESEKLIVPLPITAPIPSPNSTVHTKYRQQVLPASSHLRQQHKASCLLTNWQAKYKYNMIWNCMLMAVAIIDTLLERLCKSLGSTAPDTTRIIPTKDIRKSSKIMTKI